MRKAIAGTAIAICFLIATAIWQTDVSKDKSHLVKVSAHTYVYQDWDCGYLNGTCESVYQFNAESVLQVHRIRYGKDFMAVKVKTNNISGWVMLHDGAEIYKKSNT